MRFTGVNTGFYICRQCTWKGTRLVGGNIVEVLGKRPLQSNWVFLVVLLVILGFSTTVAIQVRSSLTGSPIRAATINSAFHEAGQLVQEASPVRDESGHEDTTLTTSELLQMVGQQDELQDLHSKIDKKSVEFDDWIRNLVLNVINVKDNGPDDTSVEESTENGAPEASSSYSPINYEE
jgi:hypothetical protein